MPTRVSLVEVDWLSAKACFLACSSFWANSASVRVALVPRASGRCIGTPMLPGHIPWRSGSPHGVLGWVHSLLVDNFVDRAWPKAEPTVTRNTATRHTGRNRRLIL